MSAAVERADAERPQATVLNIPAPAAVLPMTPEGTDLAHVIPADSTVSFRGLRVVKRSPNHELGLP